MTEPDIASPFEWARRRGTIYEVAGEWRCTTHGSALVAQGPDRMTCPTGGCNTEIHGVTP